MLVEYLQYECLDSIFKQKGAEELSFIGGTAIRFIYNSQRFSEDLDFDNFGLDVATLKHLFGKVCKEIEVKGFEVEYRFLTRGKNFHCYLKFPAVLRQYGLPAHHQEKILVSMDAERKIKIVQPEIKPINKFGIFRNIAVNPAPVLLAQKLLAILFRKREKGRDFYDVSFLGGLTKPDYNYIEQVSGLGKEDFKAKLLKRCLPLNYKTLANDVAPFLFNADQKKRVLNFGEVIPEILS
jgi:predicted nucleotidyltransferase component of viral defense system